MRLPQALQLTINKETPFRLNWSLEKFMRQALDLKGIRQGQIEFSFVSRKSMRALHKQYLQSPTDTDIITFNLSDEEQMIGDVYICTDQARANAVAFANSFSMELRLLIVHGILHLLDYRDDPLAAKKLMDLEQNRILALLCPKAASKARKACA